MTTAAPFTAEHWAETKPDDIAFIEGDRSLTWAQLNNQANRVAHALLARGVKEGDIVVLRTQIRLEWTVLAEALTKIGCPLLGLNWRLTPSEVQYVLSNSGAQVVVCDDPDPTPLLKSFEGLPIKLAVSIDTSAPGFVDYEELLKASPEPPLFGTMRPKLILYTSGTTGLPKGVAATASGSREEVLEYNQDVASRQRAAPGGVALLTMPLHHGAGPAQVWGATAMGNTLVMLRRFDPEETLRLIQKHRVTNWTGVPTMYKRIAGLPPDVVAKYDVSSLKNLGVGAAPVPFDLKKWIIEHFGNVLSEGYGATEVGMLTHASSEMQLTKPGSSGKPFKHVHLSIRDPDGNELPPNSFGEIWAKTPIAIQNYLNAPPLGPDVIDSKGFFRVGDMGRIDEDGYLFITDRAKDMIISGGVNIYPAEIEAALLKNPDIQDAAVIGIPDDEFGEQVKAFCELKPGHKTTPQAILAFCEANLASYKRPKSIDIVDELPRNTMGKLLKRDLRAPYWQDRERKV